MSDLSQHAEWLSLIDVSGPFLAEPVLKQVFPQGLEQINPLNRKSVRQAYEEWREAIDLEDPQLPAFHKAWVDLVLKRVLELDEDDEEDILKPQAKLSDALTHLIPEHGIELRPNYAVVDEQNDDRPLMLIQVYHHDASMNEPVRGDGWTTSPAERMVALCRANDVRLGLLTNGESWMLIDAPVGGVATFASWYARLWGQEPITLQAFVNLLGIRRFFVDTSEQLPALFDESLKLQDEVTDELGEQVRRAVEVLIQRLDRADVDLNRELLVGVEPSELYEAALTVMMRIVFLLSAEERGLLLMEDERYEANYAVSTLRMQLREESEEILERRQDAWSRLLSIFRAVYGGIQHEAMRLPALGGSLFDPDRFPFLEGRARNSNWKNDPAKPLPIDNRTVLLLLDAVQLFQGRTLSYRALDVEQIGYVYEGLLERTVVRAMEVTLDLDAAKKSKKPWVTLDELEAADGNADQTLSTLLEERTGSSSSRVLNDLAKKVDEAAADKLLTACHGDQALRDRIKPYFHFLRMDSWGYPLVYPENTFMVTTGTDRRETGTHYTPKSLTEAIVKETLEPVVYLGPSEGKPREKWSLKSPAALLDLKICDPAMGSGAFLVQACRWLSERLVEAWEDAEKKGNAVTSEGLVVEKVNGYEPLRNDAEERLLTARRLIAERCLYGVDINPLAVELAKLSIWLVTLAKGRPFGFLDHNLRSGDTLLGIYNLEQLHYLEMQPGKGSSKKLFAQKIDRAVDEAVNLRAELRSRPIRDIRDVEVMAGLDRQARRKLELPELIANAFIGEVLAANGSGYDSTSLSIEAGGAVDGDESKLTVLSRRAFKAQTSELPKSKNPRRAFHWPLEFPEVFCQGDCGFNAIVGNPPFLGGTRISTAMGQEYREYLVHHVTPGAEGRTDLVAHFFNRSFNLLASHASFGLLATNSISEGETRQAALERLVGEFDGTIYAAYPNEIWPGKAAVVTSRVHLSKGGWKGNCTLNGRVVTHISAFLSDQEEWSPKQLKANAGKSFIGSNVLGMGFVLSKEDAKGMISTNPKNKEVILPYLNGKDLNSDPQQYPSRWVINFWDWPEEKSAQYAEPYEHLRDNVYPERLEKSKQNSYRNIMSMWWLHWNNRPGLYTALGRGHLFLQKQKTRSGSSSPLKQILVCARVSKTGAFVFVDNDLVYSDQVILIASDRYEDFSLMQSSIHVAYAWKHSSQLKSDMRYTPTDVFETFPFPSSADHSHLERLGEEYHSLRSEVMRADGIGLTKLYNRFHHQDEVDPRIGALRELHRQIDEAVANAYEWTDMDLEHGFHQVDYLPENDRTRYTISEAARLEVLRRLSALNRDRYKAEQSASKSKPTKESRIQQGPAAGAEDQSSKKPQPQTDLFEAPAESRQSIPEPTTPVERVYEWIEEKRGSWVPKHAILTGTGIDMPALNDAIAELIADDDLEQQGEGDEARYRAKL